MKNTTIATLATFGVVGALLACSDDDEVSGAPDSGNAADAPPSEAGVPGADARAHRPLATPRSVTCTATPCAVELAGENGTFCARLDDGTVRCWGSNRRGRLGRGSDFKDVASATPAPVVGLTKITRLTVSTDALCAQSEDGYSKCWGGSGSTLGQYVDDAGTPSNEDIMEPVTPSGAPKGPIFTGPSLACAAPEAGNLVCWGTNNNGRILGVDVFAEMRAQAVDIGGRVLTDLQITDYVLFGTTASGELVSWGSNTAGLLGRLSSRNPAPPSPIALGDVLSLRTGATRAFAIAGEGIFGWGRLRWDLNEQISPLPTYVRFLSDARPDSLAVSQGVACATFEDKVTRCWGDNRFAQLGTGNTNSEFMPVAVEGLAAPAVSVALDTTSSCALLEDGRVQCWGWNQDGQLGLGTRDASTHPHPETVKW